MELTDNIPVNNFRSNTSNQCLYVAIKWIRSLYHLQALLTILYIKDNGNSLSGVCTDAINMIKFYFNNGRGQRILYNKNYVVANIHKPKQYYPNLLNPSLLIRYFIHESGETPMKVYYINRSEVELIADHKQTIVIHEAKFYTNRMLAGIYNIII